MRIRRSEPCRRTVFFLCLPSTSALRGWFRGTGTLGASKEIDVIAFVELGDDDFNVLLPERGQEKFLGCGSREKRSAGIFLQDFMNGDADLVSSARVSARWQR